MWTIVSVAAFEATSLKKKLDSLGVANEAFEIGMGIHQTLKSTALNLANFKNKDILFIGTCGQFTPFQSPGTYLIPTVKWSPTCERLGKSYRIPESLDPIKLAYDKTFESLPKRTCLCSSNVSLNGELPENHNRHDYVENIELYSFAWMAASQARSFSAVLTTTNYVGPEAHEEWKNNFNRAASDAAKIIAERLK